MKLPRRHFLHLAAGAAALPALSRLARAQAYPSRPVRIIVGFPAGGTGDISARLMGQWLSERLGQPFIVENRPGAAGNIAAEAVVRAPADGYTMLLVVATNTVNASLFDKLSFNLIRDIAPAAGLSRSPLVLEVNPALPVNAVPEFISYVRANSGKVSLASYGTGTISHLAGELFKMNAGVHMLHVPYRGSSPMLTDLLAG
jgi:tripartite-type tricarboxylate transporter receptor subunit TctC